MRRFSNATMGMVNVRPRAERRNYTETSTVLPDTELDDLVEVVASLKASEVAELVESGEAELEDVIEAERVGKNRKTVLHLVKSDSGKVYPVYNRDQPDTDSDENQEED